MAAEQVFVGIGINIISHILITHLGKAERQFRGQEDAKSATVASGPK
jgi:hypothetical protein